MGAAWGVSPEAARDMLEGSSTQGELAAAGRSDQRAVAARRHWRSGGGRKRLEWLRRWEVDEGREADKRGRWRIGRVLDVRRPTQRRGRQLEVQIEWAGVDVASGNA